MKRMLCIILSGLLLFPAVACVLEPVVQVPDSDPTEAPAERQSGETPTGEPAASEPTEEPIQLEPIADPPIQPGQSLDKPIELTDPVQPIYEIQGEQPAVNGYTDFSDLLSAAILSGTRNQNLSPISVYLALAMVAEGANGDTQAELLKLLGCKDLKELRGICGAMLETLSVDEKNSTLDMHNSLWMAETINGETVTFRPEYLSTLSETYRSEANVVEFGTQSAARQIAEWINRHTRGKINVSPDALNFDPSTLAVLINTIYLKDAWCDEFYENATVSDTFFAPDGEMTAAYMDRTDNSVSIVKGDGFLRYSLPLLRVGRMTFVLPDEGTELSGLLGSPEKLHALLSDGEAIRADVHVKLPKFKFQSRFDLNEPLKALGIGIAFTDGADFSGMCDLPAYISRVLQESYIGVDEKGVEAAAYTMVAMNESCAMPEELPKIDFFLTRPFLYAIESRDGTVLFLGTVTNPAFGE